MQNWNATSFIDECQGGFVEITDEADGFLHLAPRTRLLAYAKTAFENTTGEERWLAKTENSMMQLIDTELSDPSMFLSYGQAVTAFASYVYGAIEGKRFIGEFDDAKALSAQMQLVGYDFLNMEKIGAIYERALKGDVTSN